MHCAVAGGKEQAAAYCMGRCGCQFYSVGFVWKHAKGSYVYHDIEKSLLSLYDGLLSSRYNLSPQASGGLCATVPQTRIFEPDGC